MQTTREPTAGKRRRGRLALLSAGALVLPLAVSGLAPQASAPAPPTPAQRVQAIASPSIVYVGVRWRGWVLMPSAIRVDGTLTSRGWQGPFTVDTACSGFVADSTGYVVTAGHCVDNQSMTHGGKAAIIDALIQGIHATFPEITAGQLELIRSAVEESGRVEDRASGSPPLRTVTVYPAGNASANGLVANTVEFRGLTEGDVALLKVTSATPLSTLAVAPTSPPVGTSILLAGYVGSVSQIVDPGQEPSFKDGETSSHQTINGVPFTEVSAAAGAGMSGGPALDMQARVIGTVSFKPGSETAAFNFVTGTSTIRSLLARNGVANTLTAADRAYRAGLDAYFAGRYHDAVASFDKVLAVQPDNTSAQHYRQLSMHSYGSDVGTGGSDTVLWIVIPIAVAVVLLVAAALVLLRRRRGGAPPVPEAPVAAPAPTPVGPAPSPSTGLAPTTPPAGPPAPAEAVPAAPVETASTSVATTGPEPVEAPRPEPVETAQPEPVETTQPATAGQPSAPAGYCPNCGTPHDARAHFCEACGARVRVVATAGRGHWNGRA